LPLELSWWLLKGKEKSHGSNLNMYIRNQQFEIIKH
jgi:hypothetical protein